MSHPSAKEKDQGAREQVLHAGTQVQSLETWFSNISRSDPIKTNKLLLVIYKPPYNYFENKFKHKTPGFREVKFIKSSV